MRAVFIVAIVAASGCSGVLRPVASSPSPDYASLSMRDAEGKPFQGLDGIWFVDHHRFKAPQRIIYVAQGRRSVGYQCPDWISLDDFAALQYEFEAGRSYEMVCESEGPVIYALSQ